MNRLKKIFTKIFPYDKLLHFTFGVFLSLIFYDSFAWGQSLLITLSLAVIIELYDKISKKGTPEVLDIVYTIVGWGIAFLIMMI